MTSVQERTNCGRSCNQLCKDNCAQIALAILLGCLAMQLARAQTGSFIDRQQPEDLRVVSYNVFDDGIFPDIDPIQAGKFDRVVNALDPDILNLQEVSRSATEVAGLMNSIAPLAAGSWQAFKGGENIIVSKYPLSMTQTIVFPAGSRLQAIALVDLPDQQYAADFYLMNNHYRCCGTVGGPEEADRQLQSDAIVSWLRDVRTPGGLADLPFGTPLAVVGDLNIDLDIVGSVQALNTLITGDIDDETTFGSDSPPDWDGSSLTDSHPLHNGSGPSDYTWRNNNSQFVSGRLDYIIYSDSVLDIGNQFVLNTIDMDESELAATGLQQFDISLDLTGVRPDHLPVVVDFRITSSIDGDFDNNNVVDGTDLLLWQRNPGLGSLANWEANYGLSGILASAATVPEPSSLAGVLILGSLALHRRHR